MAPPSPTAASTGRPAARYDVSLLGSDMSATPGRSLTTSRSAAASASGYSPSSSGSNEVDVRQVAGLCPHRSALAAVPDDDEPHASGRCSLRSSPRAASTMLAEVLLEPDVAGVDDGERRLRPAELRAGRLPSVEVQGSTCEPVGQQPDPVVGHAVCHGGPRNASLTTATRSARVRANRSRAAVARAAAPPPLMPLCEAAFAMRSWTTTNELRAVPAGHRDGGHGRTEARRHRRSRGRAGS